MDMQQQSVASDTNVYDDLRCSLRKVSYVAAEQGIPLILLLPFFIVADLIMS
jgi:hypothetical protein